MKQAPILALSLAPLACAGAELNPATPASPNTAPVVDLDQKPPPPVAAPKPAAPPEPEKKGDEEKKEDGPAEYGMIGLLNSGDPLTARGNMWGSEIDGAFGAGGLGLVGVGGGGGKGEGIGLGNIGTLGHGAGTGTGQGFGSGSGRLGGSKRTKPPQIRMGATTVAGRLPPEVIQRIVRQSFGRFRLCYENGLRNNSTLQGRVVVKFVIDGDGSVKSAAGNGSELPDKNVIACVTRAFLGLSFPQPEGGKVVVTYPMVFTPGEAARPDYGTTTLPKTQSQPSSVATSAKPSTPAPPAGAKRP